MSSMKTKNHRISGSKLLFPSKPWFEVNKKFAIFVNKVIGKFELFVNQVNKKFAIFVNKGIGKFPMFVNEVNKKFAIFVNKVIGKFPMFVNKVNA